jgi:hypothetical protein
VDFSPSLIVEGFAVKYEMIGLFDGISVGPVGDPTFLPQEMNRIQASPKA